MATKSNLTQSQENRNTAAFTAAFCPNPTLPTNPLSRRRFLTGLIGLIPLAAARPLSPVVSTLIPPEESPAPTALELYHTFLDLHRAGDADAAAMALGDCIFALPKFHRNYVANLVGVLVEWPEGGGIMNAVAQLLVEFIAQDPARSSEFVVWAMSRGHIGLEAKAAALLLKCEILKQSAADDFTAEALSQAAALLGGEG